MKIFFQIFRFTALGLAILLAYGPLEASEPPRKNASPSEKAPAQEDGHDHSGHEGHAGHGGHLGHGDHNKDATGTGKTDIKEISFALRENQACLEKEMPAADHANFHACLKTIEALGIDLLALKSPVDPAKKKRVHGYAKNLAMMAHKVDELMDAKQPEKAKAQLKKLKSQVELIESQFEELKKKDAPGK